MTQPLNINQIIETCAHITKSKGFDVSHTGTQVALFTTEIAEALEHVTPTGDDVTDNFIASIIQLCNNYEAYRKHAESHSDTSQVTDQEKFLEELADILIRIFSYVGGNGLSSPFLDQLFKKIQYNDTRPEKHGKAF